MKKKLKKQNPKHRKKAVFNIYLEPAQLNEMRHRAAETGVPIAVQVRRAVDAYLK